MDDVLTEAFIRQCPMFSIVFRELIKNNNIEQLYKDNHYEISKYYTNEYEFDFDTTILEILLKIGESTILSIVLFKIGGISVISFVL